MLIFIQFFVLVAIVSNSAWAQSGHSVCVSATSATLREQPNVNAKVTWKVGKYMPFLYIDKKGYWLQVQDLDGEKHWIHNSNITFKWQCVVVKLNTATLRTGPGKNNSPAELPLADKYTPFRRVDVQDGWYQIEDDLGGRYWISDSAVWRPVLLQSVSF